MHDLSTSVGNLQGGVLHRHEDTSEVVALNLEEVRVGFPGPNGGTPLPRRQERQLSKVVSFVERTHRTFTLGGKGLTQY